MIDGQANLECACDCKESLKTEIPVKHVIKQLCTCVHAKLMVSTGNLAVLGKPPLYYSHCVIPYSG